MADQTSAPPPLTRLDALLALLLSLLGAFVRLYALQLVPTLTDETDEIQFALRIAQGGFWPAVSVDTYNGPLHHYLLALGLWAGGGATWPRLWALILGALTVGLTYLLGVSLSRYSNTDDASRITHYLSGVIAASLMAVSFVPVVVNSHLAWSNATTPFWTTLALLALAETVRRNRPARLPLVGLLYALAAQTHPTAIIYLLGGAVWLLVTRPSWLRTRWPWLALLVAALAISNLIGYNLQTSGGSAAGAAQRDYAFTGRITPVEYGANIRGFLGLAYQMVGSTFISTLSAQAGPAAVRAPVVIVYALVALAGLVYCALRRASLPLLVWLAALVLLPLINRAYDSHISARYMAPLLPLTFAAMGVFLGRGVLNLTPRPPSLEGKGENVEPNLPASSPPIPPYTRGVEGGREGQGRGEVASPLLLAPPPFAGEGRGERSGALAPLPLQRRDWGRGLMGLAALGLTAWLVAYPLLRLNEYYYYELVDGRNNARLWQIVAAVRVPGQAGVPIILDRGLREARLDAGGHVYKALGTLLDLDRIPSANPRVEELPGTPVGALMILTDAQRDLLTRTLRLEAVDLGAPLAPASPGGYGLYRVIAR